MPKAIRERYRFTSGADFISHTPLSKIHGIYSSFLACPSLRVYTWFGRLPANYINKKWPLLILIICSRHCSSQSISSSIPFSLNKFRTEMPSSSLLLSFVLSMGTIVNSVFAGSINASYAKRDVISPVLAGGRISTVIPSTLQDPSNKRVVDLVERQSTCGILQVACDNGGCCRGSCWYVPNDLFYFSSSFFILP